MLVTTDQGFIHSIDLLDTSWNPDLPAEPPEENGLTHTLQAVVICLPSVILSTTRTLQEPVDIEQASSSIHWHLENIRAQRNNLRLATGWRG